VGSRAARGHRIELVLVEEDVEEDVVAADTGTLTMSEYST
jgi:hypothetical protein